MEKSPDAFRTISEVAELLETPAHVLRFWESRFPQIRPVKRAGGRRYYRPADVALLTGIKRLLHDDGMTIRGVQKILREQGVKHVSGVAEDMGADDDAALEAALAALGYDSPHDAPLPQAEVESAQIIALETALKPAAVSETVPDHSAAEDQAPLMDEAPLTAFAPQDAAEDIGEVAEDYAGEEATQDASPAAPIPTPAAPVDLFSSVPSEEPPPAPPSVPDPVVEAPMTLWAEADESEPAPVAEVAAFPALAPESADAAVMPPSPAEPAEATPMEGAPSPQDTPHETPTPAAPLPAMSEDKLPSATLAARLRALDRASLGAQERETFGHLRMAARDLRQRVQSPVRPGS